MSTTSQTQAQEIPTGTSWTVIQNKDVKVHTYMSPSAMFANTSHIIELKNELIIVDGQFFAPYALELKSCHRLISKASDKTLYKPRPSRSFHWIWRCFSECESIRLG